MDSAYETVVSSDEREPTMFSASELVGLIAQAGPGSKLKVRSHFLPDNTSKVGFTTWRSDFTKGPAIVYYRDPDFISGVLPLGGQTVIVSPPRPRTQLGGDTRVRSAIFGGGWQNFTVEVPTDAFIKENYRFELLPPQENS